ncbi:MAG: hypothetical protein WCK58_03635 [Chloroflexota bacterium]
MRRRFRPVVVPVARVMVALLAAVSLLGAPGRTPSAEATALPWFDGAAVTSTVTNCASIGTGYDFTELGASVTTGFQADVSNAAPGAGQVYYVRVHIDGVGSPCGGQKAVVDMMLPPSTTAATSVAHPIICWASKGVTWVQTASCPTSLGASTTTPGALAILPATGTSWSVSTGGGWEFQVPVVSSTTLSNAQLAAYVQMQDGNANPTLAATRGVHVFGSTPAVFYPGPSTTLVTRTSARTTAEVFTHGQAGTVYFQLGLSTFYGTTYSQSVGAGINGLEVTHDWGSLSAQTDYHVRAYFEGDGLIDYYGADQTFRTAGAVTGLAVSGLVSGLAAGTVQPGLTVTAVDATNTIVKSYTGTVHFTTNASSASLPGDYTFSGGDSGEHTFPSTSINAAGTFTIRARDNATSSITGTQAGITVVPAAATHFTVTGFPSPATAGSAHNATVTAYDQFNNVATGYAGTVHITSSDGAAIRPADGTLTGGAADFAVTLNTLGTQSITATDSGNGSITGIQAGIGVEAVPPTASITAQPAWRASTSIPVAWSGASGAATFDVQYRRAPWNGTFATATAWQSNAPTTGATLTGTPGSTYCFSALARNGSGGTSAWTAETCTAVPLDERSMTRSTGWTAGTGAAYYKSTYLKTTKLGARLARTGVQARRIAIVVTTCPTCGKVSVYLGSTLLKTVSLVSATTVNKKVITIATFATVRTGTIAIKVVSSGKKVLVDGLVASAS